jgi:hypothetical protein
LTWQKWGKSEEKRGRLTVHELGRVRDESEESDSQKLLGDAGTVENDIDNVDEDLCEKQQG